MDLRLVHVVCFDVEQFLGSGARIALGFFCLFASNVLLLSDTFWSHRGDLSRRDHFLFSGPGLDRTLKALEPPALASRQRAAVRSVERHTVGVEARFECSSVVKALCLALLLHASLTA